MADYETGCKQEGKTEAAAVKDLLFKAKDT